MGLEGFGCQVHRPHASDDSSVDQGRGWSHLSVTRPSGYLGPEERGGGGQGTHPVTTETPCSRRKCRWQGVSRENLEIGSGGDRLHEAKK